ncbi:MAG: Gmad2 immunoglobulin-like domain-containing protein [Microthrixaceae bacterium]
MVSISGFGTGRSPRRPARATVGVLVLLAVVGAGCGEDDTSDRSTTTTKSGVSESTAPDSTAGGQSPAEPATSVPALPGSIVWPAAGAEETSSDPAEVATRFATEFVGFTSPVVGDAVMGGDGRATVEVRPRATGPVTMVELVQHGSGTQWFVVGASTPNIVADPALNGSTVTSPAELRGTSTAFEGTVDVAVRMRGSAESLATGFVTGGANGEFGPFEGELAYSAAGSEGVIVFSTLNMEDGSLWEATVVPVVLG